MDLTIKELEQRFREAWITSRQMRTGIKLGYATCWPEMIYDQREQIRRARSHIPAPAPSPTRVDRLMECTRWLSPLSEEHRRLIWLRASGLPWRLIAKHYGIERKTAYARWRKAINKVQIKALYHKN